MFDITTFAQKNYATGHKTTLDFAAFSRLFAPESVVWLDGAPTREAIEELKDRAPLWCPTVFEGDRRSAKTALASGLLVYDLDRDDSGDGVDVEAVLARLEELEAVCVHSTAKSALLPAGRAKLRVIIPLTHAVEADAYRRLWRSVGLRLGLPADTSKIGPESCFFLPTGYGVHRDKYVYVCRDGSYLDPGLHGSVLAIDLNGSSQSLTAQVDRHVRRIRDVRVNKANALVESGTGLGAIWVRSGQTTFGLDDSWGVIEQTLRANTRVVEPVADWLEARGHFTRGWEYGVRVQMEEMATAENDNNGKIANTDRNLGLLIEQTGCLGVDVRKNAAVYVRACPWRASAKVGDVVEESHAYDLIGWFYSEYGLNVTISKAVQHMYGIASMNQRDCLLDYMHGCVWQDSVQAARDYLSSLLVEMLGAEDTPATRAISLRWHVGLAARQIRPGCKLDTAMVLIGRQGIGKSTYLRELFPERLQRDCFSDSVSMDARESAIAYSRFAIIEYGELAHMSRKSIEAVKQELAAREATVRPAYARVAVTLPRRAIVAGTTNDGDFLVDVENRRFWPVEVGQLDLERLRSERDRIWAAARLLVSAGEPWWLEAAEVEPLTEVHAKHEVRDPWLETVAAFLSLPVSVKVWGEESLLPGQVVDGHWAWVRLRDVGAALGLPTAMTMADSKRLGRVLRQLGWDTFRGPRLGETAGRATLWRKNPGKRSAAAA